MEITNTTSPFSSSNKESQFSTNNITNTINPSNETNYSPHPVSYNTPVRASVDCITVDAVDWNDLKNDVSGLNFKASLVDWPSIFFGLAIPITLEIFYLIYSNPNLESSEIVTRLALSLLLILIGLGVKKCSKGKHPEALDENLKTLNGRITSIENKCPTNKIVNGYQPTNCPSVKCKIFKFTKLCSEECNKN